MWHIATTLPCIGIWVSQCLVQPNQEVVRLDIPMQEGAAVDVLDARQLRRKAVSMGNTPMGIKKGQGTST